MHADGDDGRQGFSSQETVMSMVAHLFSRRGFALNSLIARRTQVQVASSTAFSSSSPSRLEAGLRIRDDEWLILPPVPPQMGGLAHLCKAQTDMTAVNWIKQCLPRLPQHGIEKLFNLRRVRMARSPPDNPKEVKFMTVKRSECLPAGSVLYLSRFALNSVGKEALGSKLTPVTELGEEKCD